MSFNPLYIAVAAYSAAFAGVRWAEATVISNLTSIDFKKSAAGLITERSESLPITIPTIGRFFAFTPPCSAFPPISLLK